MNISEISIRNPVFAWMLMAFLIVFGWISFSHMGLSQMPEVDFPVVSVSLTLTGAAPEVMEVEVADPVEDVFASLEGLKTLSSSSAMGRVSLTLEFGLDKDIDIAVQEIQNALSRVAAKLPKGIDPPVIMKSNSDANPIIWLAVSSDSLKPRDLMSLVKNKIKNRFAAIEGVGELILGGYIEPNLRVWVSPEKLAAHELTASDVLSAIGSGHVELPSGQIDIGRQEVGIRTFGEARSVEDFGDILILRRGGAPNYVPIRLRDIGEIEDGLNDIRAMSRSAGVAAIGLGVKKQPGSNAVEVAKAVKARMEEIKKELPAGVNIMVRFDSTVFIEESIRELNFTLILSAVLTALICLLFLGSISATLNVVLAIPTAIIGSFIVLDAMGFTLNFFTLLGLSLAIGIVVDDAIMVLENIVRHREKGEGKVQAALLGSKEITLAAMAATTAIIAIYLPVAFIQGIIGKFLFQFGVTLSVAVAISLLEALTLAPMRCAQFLEVKPRRTWIGRGVEAMFQQSAMAYRRMVKVSIRFKWAVVFLSLLFFAGSLYLVKLIKKEFIPAQDQSMLIVRFETPPGSSLEYTRQKFMEVEKWVLGKKDVRGYYGVIGGFNGGQTSAGMMFLTLQPPDKRKLSQQDLIGVFRKELNKIDDIKVVIQDPSLSGFTAKRGFPIEFNIRGPDHEKLVEIGKSFTEAMSQSGKMIDVDSDYRDGLPEIQIIPNRSKARQYGVSVSDIAQTIQAMMGGVVSGQFTKDGHRYDVRVRVKDEDRTRMQDLYRMGVRNVQGEMVPLKELVTTKMHLTLQSISRQDRERAITLYANPAPASSQEEALSVVEQLGEKLPPGYRLVLSGSAQTFKDSFSSLLWALLLGILVSYMVLASQFNSFVHPFTVLVALPFSVSGALMALYLGNQTLNIYSMIALLLLMGIVKKNSILLVDFTNHMRAQGLSVSDALIEACPLRLRAILMTSIATIAAAIPPAVAVGPGAESRVPMAIAVLGGVFVSTILTLFVVPSVYCILATLERKRYVDPIYSEGRS
ncbi:MAG: efflux RND transporter permease subunit [Myxococcota bacterium]